MRAFVSNLGHLRHLAPGRSGHVLIGMAITLAAVATLGWMATDALRRLERQARQPVAAGAARHSRESG